MRATELRWPLRLLTRGRAVDLVNLELKAALVNGGFAVVTVDVRGTGAGLPGARAEPHLGSFVWRLWPRVGAGSGQVCETVKRCETIKRCCQVPRSGSGARRGATTRGGTLLRCWTLSRGRPGAMARRAPALTTEEFAVCTLSPLPGTRACCSCTPSAPVGRWVTR